MFLGPEALRLYLSRGRLQRPGVRHRVWLVLCWMSSWKVWLEQRLSAYSAYLWYPELYDQLLAQKLRKKRLLRSQVARLGVWEADPGLPCQLATLGDLKTAAQRQLQAGVLRLMHPSSGELLDLAQSVEAAGLAPEATVLAIAQPMQLSATKFSFALRCGGRVVAWGAPRDGGDCSRVQHQLREVEHLEGSDRSFSARLSSGQTVAWGGFECSTRTQELQDTLAAAQQIYDTDTAHAALMPNGGVLAWGDPERGGDCSEVEEDLVGVTSLVATSDSFCALLADGRLVTWGDMDLDLGFGTGPHGQTLQGRPDHRGGRAPRAKAVAATVHAFAAILRDDTVLAWGDEAYGGRLNVELREVEKLQATSKAFAALSTDGSIYAWGDREHGGEISETIQEQLREVRHLASTSSAFCALTADGRLVCWGSAAHGGLTPLPIQNARQRTAQHTWQITAKDLQATLKAFAALTSDGRVVCWGDPSLGGAPSHQVAASAESMEPASAEQAEAEVESVDKKRLEEEPDLGLSQEQMSALEKALAALQALQLPQAQASETV
ncbi:Rho GTPase-activating protein gacGG (GTPase activating factor for raC protein GG) [Durusdinium trenchii]|uniref:Rho GTPase-activating protein gacGG (GTPase activating factor for raC protein GG) n=1 Tax=Durusdinium trenchii TaxID=1381693 RepID=A0ABP0ILY1_9DINO